MKFWQTHIFRFIVGFDQAWNPILLGGSENVTISSQLAYNELMLGKDRRKRKAVDWLFAKWGWTNHCYVSLLEEYYEFPADQQPAIREALAAKGIQ